MIIIHKNNSTKKMCIVRDAVVFNDYFYCHRNIYNKHEFKYNTEILLVTNCSNLKNVLLFLYWHIYIINFDHITLVDNSATGLLKNYIQYFDGKITYVHRPEISKQCDIYNECIKCSDSRWILPIDDDEFLYISDKYEHNINTFLSYMLNKHKAYKYAFNWRIFNSLEDVYESNEFYIDIFKYMFFMKNSLHTLPSGADGINLVKTMIDNTVSHIYLSDNNEHTKIQLNIPKIPEYNSYINNHMDGGTPIGTVHNPITLIDGEYQHAYDTEIDQYSVDMFYDDSLIPFPGDVFLAHYRYKTVKENMQKAKKFKLTDISYEYQKEHYGYDAITKMLTYIRPHLTYVDKLATLLARYKNTDKFKSIFRDL